MRGGDGLELLVGFREGDKEAAFAPCPAFEQELQPERRLAGSGCAFHKIEPARHQTAAHYVVETGDAGRKPQTLR